MEGQGINRFILGEKGIPASWWEFPMVMVILLLLCGIFGEYYLGRGINLIISLMLLPLALQVRQPGVYSSRYGWWSLACGILAPISGNNLLVFLALGFFFLFTLEFYLGKTSFLPPLLFLLMTPLLSSWLTAFTFPLQLMQSGQLGALLTRMGMEVEVRGNRFHFEENWFAVDAACLGIHMLSMSLFIVVLLMASLEDRKAWKWWEVAGAVVLGVGLAYLANFFRMLALVIFRSPPETLGHELMGLLSLGIWVGLPVYILLGIRGKGHLPSHTMGKLRFRNDLESVFLKAIPHLGLLLLTVLVGWKLWFSAPTSADMKDIYRPGFECRMLQPGIAQLSREGSLIYLKVPTSPWRADHHPTICWRGTGFDIRELEVKNLGKWEVFTATLVNGSDRLYTSWWYDNGEEITADAWEWRIKAIQGSKPFYLVNVSSTSESELEAGVIRVLTEGLDSFFQ